MDKGYELDNKILLITENEKLRGQALTPYR